VLVGAALFTVVMNMKHIFVYMAPVYFVYILKNYCFSAPSAPSAPSAAPSAPSAAPLSPDRRRPPLPAGSDTESDTEGSCAEEEGDEWYGAGEKPRSFSPLRFIRVGLVVLAVVAVSLGPFVYLSQVRAPRVSCRVARRACRVVCGSRVA
jgi:alpha-1,3-glucosyltransferase